MNVPLDTYGFESNFRVEGELVYQGNDFNTVTYARNSNSYYEKTQTVTGDISSVALMVNGYFDLKNESRFTPFVGAGFGFAKVEVNDLHFVGASWEPVSVDDTVLALQATIGVGYEITERVTLDLKYRYFVTEDLETGSSTTEYSSNNFYSGIRFSF